MAAVMLLNDAQKICLKALENHRMMLLAKSRQAGITTALLSHALRLSIEKPDHMTMYITHHAASKHFCRTKLLEMISNCPGTQCVLSNASDVRLSNGSMISFMPFNVLLGGGCRGLHCDFIVIDEYFEHHYDMKKDIVNVVMALLSTLKEDVGKMIITLTSTGSSNDHHSLRSSLSHFTFIDSSRLNVK